MIEDYLLPNTPGFVLKRYKKAAESIGKYDFGELYSNVVILDTETTGVSFKNDRLTQIAAARIEKGEAVDWFVTFVNPSIDIPLDIQELTAITNEDVADAPSPEEAVSKLVEFVGDAKIVAHNANFDKHFVTNVATGKSLANNIWFDSLNLTRIVFPRIKSHRLQDIVKQFGGPAPSHRADVDVTATVFLWNLLLSGIMQMKPSLNRAIAGLSSPEEWSLSVIFKEISELQALETTTNSKDVSRETFNFHKDREAKIRRNWTKRSVVPLEEIGNIEERKMVPDLVIPTDEEIEELFSENGVLAEVFEGYEKRQEQLDLALAILENFRRKGILVAEAGTGIGKSLAYLVVCVEIAKRNNVPIGISTKTNALLDQLTQKDLPTLAKIYEDGINFSALKGISHYPCLRKIVGLVNEGGKTREYAGEELNTSAAIATILSFVEQSDYDDLDMLRMDFHALPKAFVTCSSAQCYKKKCPFHGRECFTYGARKKAGEAEIVVTNHSLLLSDFATGGAVLPHISRWVIDEAHTFEEEARRTFIYGINEDTIKEISERISSVKEKTCIFLKMREKFTNKDGANLFHSINEACIDRGDVLAYDFISLDVALRGLAQFDKTPKSSYEHEEIWIDDVIKNSAAYADLIRLCKKCKDSSKALMLKINDMIAFLQDYDNMTHEQAELNNLVNELDVVYESLCILGSDNDSYYQSFELSRRKSKLPFALNASAYDVGQMLNRYFYPGIECCVFTSATISVDRSFETFEENLGLKPGTDIFESEPKDDAPTTEDCSKWSGDPLVSSKPQRADEVEVRGSVDSLIEPVLPTDTEPVEVPLASEQNSALRQAQEPNSIDPQFHGRKTYEINLPSSYNFDANMTVFAPVDMAPPARPGSPENSQYLSDLSNLITSAIVAQGGSMLVLFTSRSEMDYCYAKCADDLQAMGLKAICQKKGSSTKRIADEFLEDESVSLFALKSFWEGFDAPGDTLRGVIIARLPFSKPTDPLYKEREFRETDKNVFLQYSVPETIIEVRQAVGRLIRKPTDKGVVIIADSRVNKTGYGKKILRSMPTEDVRQVKTQEMLRSMRNF